MPLRLYSSVGVCVCVLISAKETLTDQISPSLCLSGGLKGVPLRSVPPKNVNADPSQTGFTLMLL